MAQCCTFCKKNTNSTLFRLHPCHP